MMINEYAIKFSDLTITAVGFDIDDVAKCFPGADSITLQGTHSFIGDGSASVQSITKATPVASSFISTTGSSHVTIPDTADITAVKPVTIPFTGNPAALVHAWEITGFDKLYGPQISPRFDAAGTYIVKLTASSDGGESVPQYMKITVT